MNITDEQLQAWLVRSDDAGRLAHALLEERAEIERLQARVRELEAAIFGLHDSEGAYGFESAEWNARYAHAFDLAAVRAETEDDDG